GSLQLSAEPGLDKFNELVDSEPVEHVLESCLGSIGAIPMFSEDSHHRVGDGCRLGWFDDDAGFTAEIPVAGDAAKGEPEPHAGLDPEAFAYFDRGKSDIVRVLENRDRAGAIESDIELAGNSIEGTIIENMEVPFTGVGARIDQLIRIDTGSRCSG